MSDSKRGKGKRGKRGSDGGKKASGSGKRSKRKPPAPPGSTARETAGSADAPPDEHPLPIPPAKPGKSGKSGARSSKRTPPKPPAKRAGTVELIDDDLVISEEADLDAPAASTGESLDTAPASSEQPAKPAAPAPKAPLPSPKAPLPPPKPAEPAAPKAPEPPPKPFLPPPKAPEPPPKAAEPTSSASSEPAEPIGERDHPTSEPGAEAAAASPVPEREFHFSTAERRPAEAFPERSAGRTPKNAERGGTGEDAAADPGDRPDRAKPGDRPDRAEPAAAPDSEGETPADDKPVYEIRAERIVVMPTPPVRTSDDSPHDASLGDLAMLDVVDELADEPTDSPGAFDVFDVLDELEDDEDDHDDHDHDDHDDHDHDDHDDQLEPDPLASVVFDFDDSYSEVNLPAELRPVPGPSGPAKDSAPAPREPRAQREPVPPASEHTAPPERPATPRPERPATPPPPERVAPPAPREPADAPAPPERPVTPAPPERVAITREPTEELVDIDEFEELDELDDPDDPDVREDAEHTEDREILRELEVAVEERAHDRALREHAARPPTAPPRPRTPAETTVAVFEPGPTNRDRATSIVEQLGYCLISGASTGEVIRKISASHPPELLLVGLPGGEDVVEAAHALGGERPIIIAALAAPLATALERCRAAEADLFVLRPHEMGSLAPVLHAAVTTIDLQRRVTSLRGTESMLRERLQRFGQVDEATGFQHFDFFKHLFSIELKRARRFNYPLSVCLIEIDPLVKPVAGRGDAAEGNGAHAATPRAEALPPLAMQEVRTHVAAAISSAIRDVDQPVDLGEDRFLVMLPHTDIEGAEQVGHRIVRIVSSGVARYEDRAYRLTASIGIAALREGQRVSFARLMKDANAAMRAAQLKGGGQVVVRR